MLLLTAVLLGCGCASPPIDLRPGEVSQPVRFEVPEESEVLLQLRMSADTDWAEVDREAAVVTLFLDGTEGERNQEIVLFRGRQPFVYRVALGRLAAGDHALQVVFNSELSAPKATKLFIHDIRFRFITPDSADFDVYRYSPVLFGRDDNATTDTPLLMYHEVRNNAEGKVIEYTVIWSNEDAGTNSVGLMSRWGRTTDIELVYRVFLNRDGELLRDQYHGAGHDTLWFQGVRIADHPVLRTASLNNVVSDSGRSKFKFFLSPEWKKGVIFSREVLMDRNPWTYEIMAKEMRREGRYEDPADPSTLKVSDARNCLYIEFESDMHGTSPRLTFGVRLRGDSTWYLSDHGIDTVQAVNRSGWRRTTIELPPGTRWRDVQDLTLRGAAQGAFEIELKTLSRMFFLRDDFSLDAFPVVWRKPVRLTESTPAVTMSLAGLGKKDVVVNGWERKTRRPFGQQGEMGGGLFSVVRLDGGSGAGTSGRGNEVLPAGSGQAPLRAW